MSHLTGTRAARTASLAVFGVFAVSGFVFASWVSRLPAIRDGLGLTPGQIGLVLLVGSAGSMVALPLTGAVVQRIVDTGVALEVCPTSNVALGVYESAADVPLRTLYDAGVVIALSADDPLLFGSRLTEQYEIARRYHDFDDEQLAELARMSVRSSYAPRDHEATVLAEPNTPYDVLVQVMDAVRVSRFMQGKHAVDTELFPTISIGDAPLVRSPR